MHVKYVNKLFGLPWQGTSSKDVLQKYQMWFSRKTTFDQCACLYARVGLFVHHWWVRNRYESKKKKYM